MRRRGHLICFDLDNTLIAGNTAQVLAYQLAFRKHHLPPVPDREIVKRFGIVGRVLVKQMYPFLRERELTRVVYDHDKYVITATAQYVKSIPGVAHALKQLRKEGYVLAVVSNSRHRTLFTLMKAGGIDRKLFAVCLGNDDVLHPKPAPDEILKAEHLVRLDADYIVGDTIYDLMAARTAGVKGIGVLTGNHSRSLLRRYKPYAILKSVAELPRFLRKEHICPRPALFFVTGVSGVGKSTLVRLLQKKLPFADVHDIDEDGVPKNAGEQWRKRKSILWLRRARTFQRQKKATVVCGITVPSEIVQSRAYAPFLRIRYGLIHLPERLIRQRLRKRGWGERMAKGNIAWARRLYNEVRLFPRHYIVEAKQHTPEQLAELFAQWVRRETGKR